MKILNINTSDIKGGAAKVAFRILEGIREQGVSAEMMVQQKSSDHYFVHGAGSNIHRALNRLRIPLDNLPKLLHHGRQDTTFHLQWLPEKHIRKIQKINPDIVHLHWICRGFIKPETLSRLNKPIVWTLHDMWPFTGGCHYAKGCRGYEKQCGLCPQLGSKRELDLSSWVHNRKSNAWRDVDLTIVAPSDWLAGCARKSSLFKNTDIRVIPNGIDLSVYKSHDKKYARQLLGLSENAHLILFGAVNSANDKRKGFHLLLKALSQLACNTYVKPVELVVFGASTPENPPQFKFKTRYTGSLYDDLSLSLLYSACDVFVAPSLEDNLPNTIMESMACGTPCAAFNIGGIPDMMTHKKNGYLARPYDIDDLAKGIHWIISDRPRWESLSFEAKNKVRKEYDLSLIAKRYINIYEEHL